MRIDALRRDALQSPFDPASAAITRRLRMLLPSPTNQETDHELMDLF
jgi:hypothetical protein